MRTRAFALAVAVAACGSSMSAPRTPGEPIADQEEARAPTGAESVPMMTCSADQGHSFQFRLARTFTRGDDPGQCELRDGEDVAASPMVLSFEGQELVDSFAQRKLLVEPDGAAQWMASEAFADHGTRTGEGEVTVAGEPMRYYRMSGAIRWRTSPGEMIAGRLHRGNLLYVFTAVFSIGNEAQVAEILDVWRTVVIQ